MSRKINCKCGKYLGEIKDARLARGIVYQCATCASRQVFRSELDRMDGEKSMIDRFKRGFINN